jgi:uncharacterized membrane protein
MNAAHFHLMVNHLPIIFPIVGIIVLIIGLVIKSDAVKRTAYLIFIIGALASIVAMKSGEEAEDVVENISGVTENYIESHEESAEVFSILTYILGGLSLLGLWTNFKKKSITNVTGIAVLVFSFGVVYFGLETGTTGGEIRHTEIRANSQAPATNDKNETDDDD